MPSTRRNHRKVIVISMVTAMVILLFDLNMPLGVAGGVPYVALVLIGLWSPWRYYIFLMAVVGTVLTVVGYFASPAGGIPWVVLSNRTLALFAIWITAFLVIRIHDSELHFRTILDTAAEGIITTNSDGLILSFNKAAETIFDYFAEEVVGRNVLLLIPSPEGAKYDGWIVACSKTGGSKIAGSGREVLGQRKDGTLFPLHLELSEFHRGNQQIFTGIVRDLTAQKQAEDERRKLSRIAEQIPASIIITDTLGNIEYTNPKFSQVTGYTNEEVIGKNPRFLKSGDKSPIEYKRLWETISSGREWQGKFHNKKKNGELFWESVSITPLRNAQGVITNFLAVKEDITDRLEKERQLVHAMKMEAIGRLSGGIAHDFNNLLTIILGNLQLLGEDLGSSSKEITELIDDATSAALDGAELTQGMLLFSRKQVQHFQPVNINEAINDFVRRTERMLGETIKLKINLSKDPLWTMCDPVQFDGVILNLAINARDAMPEGGTITIKTKRKYMDSKKSARYPGLEPGNYLTVSVSDTGVGMDEEVLSKACEPFFTTKQSSKGSGLGLSTAYSFADEHAGQLTINSTLGEGTLVTILLKESAPDTDDAQAKDVSKDFPGGSETILVVDDRPWVRKVAVRVLNRLGYQVLEASNSSEAMQFLATDSTIALLFSDIVMPGGMNGYELASQAVERYRELKVLLTTGFSDEVRDKHPDYFHNFPILKKPYSKCELAAQVREALGSDRKTS